jgi:LysM repeat protein
MLPKDFDPGFGEEKDMPPETQEKAPGVYVRAENELPHELDLLWSNTRPYHREERSPLLAFIAGVLVGGILTAAVFLLFIMKPHIHTNPNEMTAPVTNNSLNDGQGASTESGATPSAGNTTTGPTALSGAAAGNATSYTVVSGDTLGRIAEKVYGSADPKYVDKIQRANSMTNPNSLKLDQKLVIPPKNY